jgi:hypothetical protein
MRLPSLRSIAQYIDHPDPLVAASNKVAIIIAGNQPFFPLYFVFIVGSAAWPALATLWVTPILAAVPALSKRSPFVGRIVFSLAATLNSAVCTKALGEESGTALFFLPCAMLAAMLFRRTERWAMIALVGLAIGLFVALAGRYGAPLHIFSADEYAAIFRLNSITVGVTVAMLAVLLSGLNAPSEPL